MAIVAGGFRGAVERVMVTAYPGLAEIVHSMGAAVDAVRHGCMADRAFADRRGVPLRFDGRCVVVHLVTVGAGFVGELGMGRVVASLALQFAVTGAEAE